MREQKRGGEREGRGRAGSEAKVPLRSSPGWETSLGRKGRNSRVGGEMRIKPQAG